MLYKNLTCNHNKALSQISKRHPFDAVWRGWPNSRPGTGVFQVMVRGTSWGEEGFGSSANSQSTPVPRLQQGLTSIHKFPGCNTLSDSPLHGSYTGNSNQLGRPFTAFPPANHSFVWVARLSADAHLPAHATLRPTSADFIQPHTH
ncbi:hypothetical protein O181_064494 [Austropuccinia psidii MF-1]|uniref:Uncharacterized protein n=1 Tax=Austropuccinia psidii MF-1 TaxID=1389203 RepID=A0A9Q3EPJ5_9BASI|nr:hypothetical protein [Austropuccinia psidii MF-1]